MAVPAFTPQNNIADDGDVIVNPYAMTALLAVGRWKNDRLPFRNPEDQDIEKTPNGGAHARKKYIQKCVHTNLVNAFPLFFARRCTNLRLLYFLQ
jgi:hypothetical protein